jgi:hypothetical protein
MDFEIVGTITDIEIIAFGSSIPNESPQNHIAIPQSQTHPLSFRGLRQE